MSAEQKTDKRVLAPYYLLADTADLLAARKSIEFELYVRMKRDKASAEIKARDAERASEMRAEVDAITDIYNHETQGL